MHWLWDDHHFKQMMSKLLIQRLKIAIIRILKMLMCLNMPRVLSPKCFRETPDTELQYSNFWMMSFLLLLLFPQLYLCLLWHVHLMITSSNNSTICKWTKRPQMTVRDRLKIQMEQKQTVAFHEWPHEGQSSGQTALTGLKTIK